MSKKPTFNIKNNNLGKTLDLKKEEFETILINLNNIQRSEKNFYALNDIDNLAEDIELNKLYHNILVRDLGNEKYELVSGERRFLAYKKLLDEGKTKFTNIPCRVVNLNDEDAEIVLIEANALTRTLSDKEKLYQVERLKALYEAKKKNGEKIHGRIQKHISEKLGMSEATVGRLNKINMNLSDDLKDKVKEDKLGLSNADILSTLSKDKQEIANKVIEKKHLTKDETKTLKDELNQIDDNNIDLENPSDEINSIIKKYTESKDRIIHTKELDLKNKIDKINNLILKLTKDLDKKTIMNIEEGINSLNILEKNVQNLSSKLNKK